MPIPLFDALKSSGATRTHRAASALDLFFQLRFLNDSCFLHAVNQQGVETKFDYRMFSGVERSLLKSMESARTEQDEIFVWDEEDEADPSEGIALHEHSHLIWLLSQCDRVVDRALKPVTFHAETMQLVLSLSPENETVSGSLSLRSNDGASVVLDQPEMISESHLIAENRLYCIRGVGDSFRSVVLFRETFPAVQLNDCLTLLFSSFSNITVDYQGFAVQTDDPLAARPALVFQQVDEHSALHLEVSHALPGLPMDFVRDYDISRIAFVDEMEQVIRLRDVQYTELLAARENLQKRLKKIGRSVKSSEAYLIDDEDGLVLGPDLAVEFLRNHLAELMQTFELFGAEKLKRYKIKSVQPTLNVSLSHGIDFLEGDATLELEGESFSLFEALQQYKKNAYVALKDGTHAVLNADYMNKLSRLFKKKKDGIKISFFDLPLIEELMEESAAKAQLPKSREIFNGFNSLSKKRLQLPRFSGKLRPYQSAGVKWLDYLHTNKLGGCLADDMGLGKTIQTIALLSRIYPKEKKQTLLVMPKSLLFNWQRELEQFCPDLSFSVHYGTQRDIEKSKGSQLILTTYGTLRADIETFTEETFHAVILDESQAIKNLKTQTAKAALALKATFRLALSGTPVENNLGELYTLFRFLNPSMFGSGGEFERDYIAPIQKTGDKDAAKELRQKIYPFILRRLKEDVLKDLPPKVEQVLYVEMEEEQKKYYETRRRFYQQMVQGEIEKNGIAKSQFVILEAMLELRQIATVPESKTDGRIVSSKREVLAETLLDAATNKRKCLVFSNFLAGIEQVADVLNEHGIQYLSMTGATANRQQLVERFQNDPAIQVFVMTLKTGGVGLNLTAADTVFILDPWWNTSAETQAIDRTHRIGQKKTVFTYRLIARDTIEEKIQKLQQRKKELVDQIVSSDGASLKTLSESDIDHLLGE